ncbi:MAG: hypothetical protein O3B74_07130 [Proteobacteria bacterium]|nr:hypothetical protein [Pseudomonadota bacterium]MDA1311093.1 hypothetical protein [Pseudomonadota bacterium]
MSLFQEIAKELLGMFLTDGRLTGAILVLVLIVAALIHKLGTDPLVAGAVLLFGCLAIIAEATARETRRKRQQ